MDCLHESSRQVEVVASASRFIPQFVSWGQGWGDTVLLTDSEHESQNLVEQLKYWNAKYN